MKVVSIGAGNVATHLISEMHKHSFDIVQVFSRTMLSAETLAREVDAIPVNDLKDIVTDADLYVFSLKDSVTEGVAAQLTGSKGIWIHTAGSLPMDIFSNYTIHYGVLYPFQTFSKNRDINWKETPLFVEASDTQSFNTIRQIAELLSAKVFELQSDERRYLHLTGVFACNFTNHLYAISERILNKINLPFDVALPLIDETASKVHQLTPKEAQTGPAIRYDENVIHKHLSLIDDDRIRQIYELMSKDINESNISSFEL